MNTTTYIEAFSNYQLDLIEAACDWAFITDESLSVLHCHKGAAAVDSILPQNLIGINFSNFLPMNVRPAVMSSLFGQTGEGRRETFFNDPLTGLHQICARGIRKEGFVGYSITVSRLSAENLGELRKVLYGDPGRTIDQQAALQLKQQKMIADLAFEYAKHAKADVDELFAATIERLGNFMGVDRCSVFRHDLEKKTYGVVYEWCAPGVPSTKDFLQNIPYNDDDEGFIQLTTRPYLAVDDTFQYTGEAYRIQRESGVHSFVDLPILCGGQFWGFLGADYGNGPHYWTESEFHMLQTIGSIMSSTLDKQSIENKLHEAYSKLSEIVDNYPGIIWATDRNNLITYFEGKGYDILGIAGDALIGTSMDELMTQLGDGAEIVRRHNDTYLDGDQSYYATGGGRHYTCETSLVRTINGEISGVVGVALDVTDMREMQERLEVAILEAERASRSKSDFLSRMSHEIRTPMNAIIGMNEIAKKSDEPERLQYCLSKIEQASRQLLAIINDILDLSKIESGKMEISLEEFDFEKMLQSAHNAVLPKIEEKRLEFTFDLDSSCDCYIISDEMRLTQVITNLFSNAVKFTPERGRVTLRSRFLERDGGTVLRVEVQDTGIGISAEDQAKLFQPFEQADGSITRRYGGTGLGLAICDKIMGLMGGEIWVESREGEGANFIFEVAVSFGGTRTGTAGRKALVKGTRILVVDDSEDVLESCRAIITGFRMHCDVATGGEEALLTIRESEQPYDVIFLDWRMPGMDGLETAEKIREIVSPDTIVIMISSADWGDLRQAAADIGVTHFLPKPLLPSTLFDAILQLTGNTQEQLQGQIPEEDYSWAGKTILVAEDIEINREIVCSLLEPTGMSVECAENGSLALEMYCENPFRYDLILMDVQMPVMDGYEATRRLRASGCPNASEIPIFAMTANAFSEDVEKCLEAGMNGHISKPFDVDELMEKIQSVFVNCKN